ncbi:hypothetical protein BSKO_02299 [Bryopsis sp. KO-2023]|nr:hypothetical protein BSKO_02299 [Bryopsis sp. KO-2023]
MPTKSGDSKSSEGKGSPRSVLADRKLDRFAKPASVSYTRDGRPFVGLPDEPSIEVRRHAIEAKWARMPNKVSRKMEVKPTPFTRAQGGVRKDSSQSRRFAARGQFEAAILARRESEDLGSSKFLAQRAACIEMDRVRREEAQLLTKFPHGATKHMAHKHSVAHSTDLPGLGYDQKPQPLGRS